MTNEDKMLQLVLSDENLSSFYKYNAQDYQSVSDALYSENTIVVAVAKIIRGFSKSSDKGTQLTVYKEVFHYLNQSLL